MISGFPIYTETDEIHPIATLFHSLFEKRETVIQTINSYRPPVVQITPHGENKFMTKEILDELFSEGYVTQLEYNRMESIFRINNYHNNGENIPYSSGERELLQYGWKHFRLPKKDEIADVRFQQNNYDYTKDFENKNLIKTERSTSGVLYVHFSEGKILNTDELIIQSDKLVISYLDALIEAGFDINTYFPSKYSYLWCKNILFSYLEKITPDENDKVFKYMIDKGIDFSAIDKYATNQNSNYRLKRALINYL